MAKRKKNIKLGNVLVLHQYILQLLGYESFDDMAENFKDSTLEGYSDDNVSWLHLNMSQPLARGCKFTKEQLYEYDQNIVRHTLSISHKRTETLRWKYFQYFSLLFTEIYLDQYFKSKEKLVENLNQFISTFNANNEEGVAFSRYTEKDINKLAFWNATGSGKTLLMHINILQYAHYAEKHNAPKVNKILLVTPNEGLSNQHLGEFIESNITAETFTKGGGIRLEDVDVEVIEISKLAETSGDKTVAVDAFETNNLVLIDEGHRGISGDQWKTRRDTLSEQGFAFEYSATFGQAVSASKGKQKGELIQEYAKSIIFDYSYKYFYSDGYGKDFRLLNINDHTEADYLHKYMIGGLLAFYEQKRVFKDKPNDMVDFHIENPLWVFVGSRVTKSVGVKTAADVVRIIQFFSRFIGEEQNSKQYIKEILDGDDGLLNQSGISIFRNRFEYLKEKKEDINILYKDILQTIFNTAAQGATVYVDRLGGVDGELGLRVGEGNYFGVVNVGDAAKLHKICKKEEVATSEKEFATSLFQNINDEDSAINVLIGSKKFTEGWSSWRVSSMGLMNVGQGEGSQIIQLFGRGVRLKGYNFSLKRSKGLDKEQRPEDSIPSHIPILETLNIFGVKADYMQKFKEYLEEEGLPTDDIEEIEILTLPIVKLEDAKLKIIQVKSGQKFNKDIRFELCLEDLWNGESIVKTDWYPKIQMVDSNSSNTEVAAALNESNLVTQHLMFLNWNVIYQEIQKFKVERRWHNMTISLQNIQTILKKDVWYTLYIPEGEMSFANFANVRLWQEVATTLLKGYCERYYNYKKADYESKHLETIILDKNHPNFNEWYYKVYVKKSEETIIRKLTELKGAIGSVDFDRESIDSSTFTALSFVRHLYKPLLYIDEKRYKGIIQISPVALNQGEKDFIEDLKNFYGHPENPNDFFKDKQLYLLRNMSKKGVGFFQANNFYPDFILWLVDGDHQHIAFIDPKGLRNINGLDSPKIQFHKTIKTQIEAQIRKTDKDISLYSFIISNTKHKDLKHWRGGESIKDFNGCNVFFQKEQKLEYVEKVLGKMSK